MESKFEHSALEQEIKKLFLEIKEKGLAEKGREAVKAAIKEQITTMPPSPAAVQPAQPAPASPLPDYLQQAPDAVKLKVEKLLDLAWHKGIKKAAEEARDSGPLIVDAFHDALTDKLYNELKQRGLI